MQIGNSAFGSAFPPAVKHLLILNGLVYVAFITPFIGDFLLKFAALWPLGQKVYINQADFYPWQLVTYMFLHSPGNMFHIVFNMFALWFLGPKLEHLWGTKRFVVYYFLTGIGAGVLQLIVGTSGAPTIGASGAVFGILLAYGMMFPNSILMLIFPPIPMKAKYFVMILGAIELFNGVFGLQTGIAHFAHLGGMLFGFLLIRYWGIKVRYD